MHRTILGLTSRQDLYLRAICRGDQRSEVAEAAFVSVSAVREAMRTAYRLLGVRNAAAACYALGLEDAKAQEVAG
jgi:DNA-binding NarL/FixJ family response regulator